MSVKHVIIDHPLPLSQDYRALKADALAFIQLHSGHEWSNLNNVDPGVTILEQVCYALTELGYCNEFPVADILTDRNGELEVKNQFYRPEEILTTAPVTINDYRKCLIDGINGVANALLVAIPATVAYANGAYQVYLLPAAAIETVAEKAALCQAAFVFLNKWRNLGELFLPPLCLLEATHTLAGRIEINDETQLNRILNQLQERIQEAIFPQVKPLGYDVLEGYGMKADEIFNGPLLQHGWIPTTALGTKKDQLQLIELQQLMLSVAGVEQVSGLMFDQQPLIQEIQATTAYLLTIDWAVSLNNGLEIYCKGRKLVAAPHLRSLSAQRVPTADRAFVFGTAPNVRTQLPRGKFRDINSYYSIQNTFPELYAVGEDARVDAVSEFEVAQSRQLKGYLTLFDQVLANQFAQLANLGNLFSFTNARSGTPSDEAHFYNIKSRLEKVQSEYPVPYLAFSPTYFYQSLYQVPNIRPLLKDNDIYGFSMVRESEKELEHHSWLAYQNDPYNAYMKGLMEIMEDDLTNLLRRNEMLDHLLARHGESPLLINTLLNGSSYAGESLKDQVIFKSLYLQNLGLLSYFRQKAYNYIGAKKVADHLSDVPLHFDRQIMSGYTNDFIFNSAKVDRMEKLMAIDFVNYAALELKMSLLLGLRALYRDFIANHFDRVERAIDLKLAMWMIMERKGLLLIETGLLLPYTTIPSQAEQVVLVFPAFIPQLDTDAFKARVALFMEHTMPVQVSYRCCFVNRDLLEILIIAFADWHNSQIYPSDPTVTESPVSNADSLMKLINQIYSDSYASK